MLKNIRLHLEKDEGKQATLDDVLAKKIVETRRNNINAFQRNIPSLLPYITESKLSSLSLFNNKYGETNIVDYGLGRVLYGFHPQIEINNQVNQALQRSPCVDFIRSNTPLIQTESSTNPFDFTQLKSFKIEQAQSPMPQEVECLIVLGCGLGLHIRHLLEELTIKNLIIYEPEIQYFLCSTMAISWSDIFALAKEKGTALFLQLEKDGRDLISDVTELKEHSSITHFYIYKHYNHEIFDSIYRDVCERDWKEICNRGFTITRTISQLEYIPTWTPKIDLSKQSPVSTESKLLETNLKAFKKYFPNIYEQYKDYKPKIWLPINTHSREINVLKTQDLCTWYGDSPKQDCVLNFDNFNEQPNKDGLILGYSGSKLAHYIHYQFVNETQELLTEAEDEVGELPKTVASIIMFGLGVGYQLEKLLSEHTVEKLFICEPNSDFFYASLFAIDWQAIFETFEANDAHIYLNVGDDGTHLFNDLLKQFHSIGPYILNNTYFYQSYYNASLNSAITQLREQLRIVIAMGEYFDHAYYGIEQMKEGFRRNYPLLMYNPSQYLNNDDKEVPVFIVGNGPSLDISIEAIKEWRDKALVVSCGTALQALYKNNITPDFHAEIEQNRVTFEFPYLIDDLDYLKKITLISCNGIHPDTCDLYKDVLIAFKEGESSTISALSVLGRQHFEILKYSFPTVSNFASNLFSKIGFKDIYFMGVDLGFVDVAHHHSKSSGYYKANGIETIKFAKSTNTSLVVPGNFKKVVNTKHEFKISKRLIEDLIKNKITEQHYYNCSDGAKILGASPLEVNNILIRSTAEQKKSTMEKIKKSIYSPNQNKNFVDKYNEKFSRTLLIEEIIQIQNSLKQKINSNKDVENLIFTLKKNLHSSYSHGNSLLFYYLYGTINYASAILVKLNKKHSYKSFKRITNAISLFDETLDKIIKKISSNITLNYDTSTFSPKERELISLKNSTKENSLLIISEDINFISSANKVIINDYPFIKNIQFSRPCDMVTYNQEPDYVIYHNTLNNKFPTIQGRLQTLIIVNDLDDCTIESSNISYFLSLKLDKEKFINDTFFELSLAIKACLSAHSCYLYLPKYFTLKEHSFESKSIINIPSKYVCCEFPFYLCLYKESTEINKIHLRVNQSRGREIVEKINTSHLKIILSKEDFDEMKNKHLVSVKN